MKTGRLTGGNYAPREAAPTPRGPDGRRMRVNGGQRAPYNPSDMRAGTTQPCLSVIVPCFNEAATIKTVVSRVLASPHTAELIVVDDGSTDGSADLLEGWDDPRLRVVRQGLNLGKGAAVRRGFLEATAPYVVVQDSDLEYDPAIYPVLLGPMLEGVADAVFGSRFAPRPHRVMYFRNNLANRALTLLSDSLTNLNLSDVMTGAKAFRREVVQGLHLEQDRFGIETEIVAKVAAARWRVYEVPIPYDGRTYEEGKKVHLRDGVRAALTALRYSTPGRKLFHPRDASLGESYSASMSEADVELAETLDSLDNATNYADWIIAMMAPHLGDTIAEIGAGHGTMSDRLRKLGRLTTSDLSPRAADRLRERFHDDPTVSVVAGDAKDTMAAGPFDSAVMVNVLEHIPDDVEALRDILAGLRPGGTLVLWVPAHEMLYSRFDRMIGHQRRYRRSTLNSSLSQAGFETVEIRYVSAAGAIAWFLIARVLGRQPTDPKSAAAYDRIAVPIVKRLERTWRPPFGQSLFAVARKPT